jgi:hypothetical protein
MATQVKGEYIALPAAMFRTIENEVLNKAQFDDERERYFRVSAFLESIRKKNGEFIFVTPEALKGLQKLYDAPIPLPF